MFAIQRHHNVILILLFYSFKEERTGMRIYSYNDVILMNMCGY